MCKNFGEVFSVLAVYKNFRENFSVFICTSGFREKFLCFFLCTLFQRIILCFNGILPFQGKFFSVLPYIKIFREFFSVSTLYKNFRENFSFLSCVSVFRENKNPTSLQEGPKGAKDEKSTISPKGNGAFCCYLFEFWNQSLRFLFLLIVSSSLCNDKEEKCQCDESCDSKWEPESESL